MSATWCGPCRAALKDSESLRKYFYDADIKFAIIWLRSNKDAWFKIAPTISNVIQIFIENAEMDDRISAHLGIKHFPTYLMIDKEGNITKDDVPSYMSPELPDFLINNK